MEPTIISIIGITLAILGFAFSLLTYVINKRQNKKELAYGMLYELNLIVLNHVEVSEIHPLANLTPRQKAYSAMVWNFIEFVYNQNLEADDFLHPAIAQFVSIYGGWFENNKEFYSREFIAFIKKKYGI